ncbi:hypothetical protein CEUSTIGMA_g11464.t1 [Chlamydomonas eustigma]|uniref:Uncharacterized protein n=1 Tax=Chlamydomonas eustigma TaxID=1157962 RepID=A0A250XMM5_9CHLO|nr:hypothetical protein CEUSTIGMA_g11464.t1 [Chlamydomonas eustigma]|eukprot:GAX84040.1 hypothetical protein CEUSTIGMA_g11464.t1 [Chlamydomonas eustigma]
MNSVWERLTNVRRSGGNSKEEAPVLLPTPNDKVGVLKYADFTECLQNHKGHVFAGMALMTAPLSLYYKSVSPLVIGTILAIVPDLIYANWRCDDVYKIFKQHMTITLEKHNKEFIVGDAASLPSAQFKN